MRRPRPIFRKTAILLLLAAVLTAILWSPVRRWRRRLNGHFTAAEYPSLRGMFDPAMVAHMPAQIPQDATGVRIFAPGVWGLMSAPDHMMELRFVLPQRHAVAIEKAAAAAQIEVDFGWQGVSRTLSTAEDENPFTPLGPGFSTFLLVNPSGSNIGGVTANSTTGEVIYWSYEN